MFDSIQRNRDSSVHLWKAICAMLQDFKYWLVEGSLHERLKPPKASYDKDGARIPANEPHRAFKEVQTSGSTCDRCRNPARLIQYQCIDCDQGYCTICWPRTRERGAHLVDIDEQPLRPGQCSVQLDNLDPPRSATSSTDISPAQMPTEYMPLQHTEDRGFSLSQYS